MEIKKMINLEKAISASLIGATLIFTPANCNEKHFSNGVISNENKEEPIKWYSSFEKAKNVASKEKKPLMLAFVVSWCNLCNEPEREIFENPKVIEFSKNYVSVKIDIGSKENYGILGKYGLGDYQLYNIHAVFTDENGSALEKSVGSTNLDAFLKSMDAALSKYKNSKQGQPK